VDPRVGCEHCVAGLPTTRIDNDGTLVPALFHIVPCRPEDCQPEGVCRAVECPATGLA
jgi:hypothetical protein